MTRAWRTRDFRAVFLLACRAGLTPENIAEMTKLPADLVVSVMKGNETLNSQALIASVARGLGMPENPRKVSGVESSSDSPALIPVQQVQKADVGRPSRRTAVRVKSPDHVGVRIAALRHQRGLTQESLAERAGISVESVSKIEQQERSPSLTMLRTLAYALGVPVGEVFGSKGLGKHASEEPAEADYRPSEGNRELQVLDFCTEMTRLMKERGVGVRELARQTSYNASYMSNMRSGRKLPSPKVAEKIDKALEANGRLVAAARSQDAGITLPRADKHRMVSDSPDISPSRLTDLGEIELLRQLVTDTLSQGGISDASLHEWGQTAIRYAKATRYRPAPLLMSDLGHDLAELNRALARQHSTSALRELTRLTGQMAGLMCLMLCVIDDRANFRRWARTARLAGNEAGDPETLSWILAQEAHGHYYSGDTLEAIDVAQHSYEVARTPCTGAALAAALEARAQATLGRDKVSVP